MNKIVNRKGQIINTKITSKIQFFLYSNLEKNFFKRILLKILVSKIISSICSLYLKSPLSKIHIKQIIIKNKINMDLFTKKKFFSYNDFFTKKYKKINFNDNRNHFISPAESKLTIFKIKKNKIFNIKNSYYTINNLLQNNQLSKKYENGYCLIFRLEPQDYHRYIFIDDGTIKNKATKINGKLHTVNPIALQQYKVFTENKREYNTLITKNFDQIVQIEIGGLLIGNIYNYNYNYFKKGQEKGFFSCGGSTIILLVKKNIVNFDSIFFQNTNNNYETQVNIGESIGKKISINV